MPEGTIPSTILHNSLVVSLLGATAGATLGLVHRKSVIGHAAVIGVNTGIASLAFFGSREYLIGPLIDSASRSAPAISRAQWSNERTQKVLDSSLSGAIIGAVLNGVMNGPRRVIPGAFAWALTTAGIQYGYNEASIARINYAIRHHEKHPPPILEESASGFSDSVMNAMTWIAPVKKLSDEEYLALMKKKQESIDKRLGQLGSTSDPPTQARDGN